MPSSIGCRVALRRVVAASAMVFVCGLGVAQESAPNTDQMVEALKPRTRSLRNLVVGDAPASAASANGAAPRAASAASAENVGMPPSESQPAAAPSLSMAIGFDFDSAHLRPEGVAVLTRLAAALQGDALKESRFLIEGHTDAKGGADYNLRLSQQRADEVQRFLESQGVAANRLSARGRGAQQPVDAAAPMAAENRRVRIVNLTAD